MNDSEAIIQEIDALEGKEQEHVAWLMSLLDHTNNLVRFSAIRPLIYRCSAPGIRERLWRLLESESDEDVLLLVISGLSSYYKGSKDLSVIRRFQSAIERVGDNSQGMRDTLDDAKLSTMLGFDTKQIVKMSATDRQRHIAEIDAKLG